jgi:hypothetical protein
VDGGKDREPMPKLTLTINGETLRCEGDEASVRRLDAEVEAAAKRSGVTTERMVQNFLLQFRGFDSDPNERTKEAGVLFYYALSLDLKEPHPGKVRDYLPALDFKIDITVDGLHVHADILATTAYPRA